MSGHGGGVAVGTPDAATLHNAHVRATMGWYWHSLEGPVVEKLYSGMGFTRRFEGALRVAD